MRTLFIICTAVTLLQIFDVSIKGVLSAGENEDASKGKPPKPRIPAGAGEKPRVGGGEKPRAGAGEKPRAGAGENPRAGAGEKPRAGAGEKPRAGAGEKPRAGAGEKPKAGEGEKPRAGEGAGIEPRALSGGREKKGSGGGPQKKPNPTQDPKIEKPDPNETDPASSDPGTDPNDDEDEPPKTIKESGKKVIKTLKNMATNRGVGLLNGVTGFLKKSGGVFNFFGNFLRDRSSNVKDVAKQSLGMVGSFSDSSVRGVSHLLRSGTTIAKQGGKEFYNTLQKATKLGTNLTKFGGTIATTPISIVGDVMGTANHLAKIPRRFTKTISNKAIYPVLRFLGPASDEQPEDEGDGEGEGEGEGEDGDGENADPSNSDA